MPPFATPCTVIKLLKTERSLSFLGALQRDGLGGLLDASVYYNPTELSGFLAIISGSDALMSCLLPRVLLQGPPAGSLLTLN